MPRHTKAYMAREETGISGVRLVAVGLGSECVTDINDPEASKKEQYSLVADCSR